MISTPPPGAPRPVRRTAGRAPAIAMVTALTLAMAGCATRAPSDTATGTGPNPVSATLGAVSVQAPPGEPDAPALGITDATLSPGPGGTEELRMTLTNRSNAPEHLYGVTAANATTAELLDAPAAPGIQGQPASAAGIDLEPGTMTAFGPSGPRILLDQPHGLVPGKPAPVTLLFALAGLIHLTAPVQP